MRDKTKQQSAPQIRGYLFMKLYKWLIVFEFYNVTAIRKLLKGCGLERVFLNGLCVCVCFVGVMKFRLYSFFTPTINYDSMALQMIDLGLALVFR